MSKDNLKSKTINSLVWDLSGSLGKQISAFVLSIMLARLLEPEEFGIVAMAMVFVSITDVFIEVGFTQGLVQRKNITDGHFNSVFIFNLIVSFFFAILLFCLSKPIGKFYESKDIEMIIMYLSPIPIIGALGKVHSSILIRSLNFKSLTIRDIISTIVGGIVGVIAAFYDFGAYSLVFKTYAAVSVGVIALWYRSNWVPSLKFSYPKLRELMSFSFYIFLDNMLRQIFNKINTLFIGKVFSPGVLGLFNRAESLNLMVSSYTSDSLRKIIFPVLSSIQDDKKRFDRIFFKAMNLAGAASTLLAGILYFAAEPIIIILLTEKWAESIPIFKILVFSTLTMPLTSLIARSIISKGFSKVKFKMGIIQRILLLLPFPLALLYGINFFAFGIVLAKLTILIVYVFFAVNYLKISLKKLLLNIFKPFIPLLICVIVLGYILDFKNINPIINTIIFIVFQISVLIIIKHPIVQFVNEILKNKVS